MIDPKDMICCFIGLANDTNVPSIKLNYTEEETVENVCRDFALRNIRLHEHLDLLFYSTIRSTDLIAVVGTRLATTKFHHDNFYGWL